MIDSTLSPRRLAALAGAAILLVAQAPHAADGAEFPDKEIRVLIGYSPGSASELSLRALVQVASKFAKKPLVVLNKPGASQSIAMGELAAAPADGYTIAMTTDGYKSLTIHQQKLRFDPAKIKVLLGYARIRHVLFVKGDSPLAKYDDFIAFGRKREGAIVYGGTGEGTGPDLMGKVFFREEGVKAGYVPFKGSGEYVTAVIGGHLQSGIIDYSGIRKYAQSGAVRLVVAFGDQRLEEFPDVPSSREKGHPDLNLFNLVRCLVVHRDTPPARVHVLHDLFKRAIEDPEFRRMAADTGLTAAYFGPREVEEGIARIEKVGVPVLKELGIFVQ